MFRNLIAILPLLMCGSSLAIARTPTDVEDTLGGSRTYAYGISANGNVIVGYSYLSGDLAYHAARYANGAWSDLGTLGGTSSVARAASSDARVIAGYSHIASGNTAVHAFKYIGTTMTDLGTLGGTSSRAYGVSSDGNVIVGYSQTTGNAATHAFKYTGTTLTDLGTLGGDSFAYGASSEGSVIVGYSVVGSANHAFRYTGTTMTDLGTLGGTNSYAQAVSADGTVIVGSSDLSGNAAEHAASYTNGSWSDLGTLGGTYGSATAVSSDGSVIAGYSNISGDSALHAFLCTNVTMTDLGTLGGTNSYARGVSADGTTIIGYSETYVGGEVHAFIYRNLAGMVGVMVDADNTVAAIANNAGQLNSLLNLKSALLSNTLDADCSMYSDKGICLSLSGWHYSGQETALATQSATTLKASYRFTDMFRAGLLADLAFSQTNPDNFHMTKTPLYGAFAVFGDNETGKGTQLRLSAAYNKADGDITRTVLDNTEAGKGSSRMDSYGLKAELGYSAEVSGWTATPYAGLRWNNVSRNGYVETSGTTFPVTYNDIELKQLTALAGLRAERKFDRIGFGAGIGVERDIDSTVGAYSGTMDALGSFQLDTPSITATRPFAGVNVSYDLAKTQRVGIGLNVERQPLGNTYGTFVSGQYTIAF